MKKYFIFQSNLFYVYTFMKLSLKFQTNICWISGFIQSKIPFFHNIIRFGLCFIHPRISQNEIFNTIRSFSVMPPTRHPSIVHVPEFQTKVIYAWNLRHMSHLLEFICLPQCLNWPPESTPLHFSTEIFTYRTHSSTNVHNEKLSMNRFLLMNIIIISHKNYHFLVSVHSII